MRPRIPSPAYLGHQRTLGGTVRPVAVRCMRRHPAAPGQRARKRATGYGSSARRPTNLGRDADSRAPRATVGRVAQPIAHRTLLAGDPVPHKLRPGARRPEGRQRSADGQRRSIGRSSWANRSPRTPARARAAVRRHPTTSTTTATLSARRPQLGRPGGRKRLRREPLRLVRHPRLEGRLSGRPGRSSRRARRRAATSRLRSSAIERHITHDQAVTSGRDFGRGRSVARRSLTRRRIPGGVRQSLRAALSYVCGSHPAVRARADGLAHALLSSSPDFVRRWPGRIGSGPGLAPDDRRPRAAYDCVRKRGTRKPERAGS